MAKTYAQLTKEIEALQAQANKVRDDERSGVLSRIREAVKVYDFTAKELFGTRGGRRQRSTKASSARGAAYADQSGNTWGGRGPRPRWLRDALASGKSLDDFRVGAGSNGTKRSASASTEGSAAGRAQKPAGKRGARPTKSAAGKGAGRRGAKAAGKSAAPKYSDGTNSWGGRGNRPAWLKEAIAAGKKLEDFAVAAPSA